MFCVAELDKVEITTEIFDKFTRLKSEKKRLESEAKGLRQQLAIAEAAGSAARGADAAGSEQQARQIGALREQVGEVVRDGGVFRAVGLFRGRCHRPFKRAIVGGLFRGRCHRPFKRAIVYWGWRVV